MSSVSQSSLITFGCNDDGQLAQGEGRKNSTANLLSGEIVSNLPKEIIGLPTLISISCGSRHTLALTSDHRVYSWGWGKMGQLGHGDDKTSEKPRSIEYFETNQITVNVISAGGCHSGAVDSKGQVYMWGEASWGQLGLGKMNHLSCHQHVPARIEVVSSTSSSTFSSTSSSTSSSDKNEEYDRVVRISCGGTHTAALTEKGNVYAWGRADSGQLGIGLDWYSENEEGISGVSIPHQVKGFNGEKVKQLECGAFHSAAVTESGQLYTWGKEDYGMLGLGHTADMHVPCKVVAFEHIPIKQVSCGGWHTLAVTEAGEMYAFGRGEYGRLGLGDEISRTRPVKLDHLSNEHIVQVTGGGSHSLVATQSGKVYSFGRAECGRLGMNEGTFSHTPLLVHHPHSSEKELCQISAGGAHSAILLH